MLRTLSKTLSQTFLFLVLAFSVPGFAKTIRADHVQVRLITAGTSEKAQLPRLAVHFKIDPEWHIYWKNPGDSGAAPKFRISGGVLQGIHWPYPVRLPVSDFTNFGYDHDAVIFLDMAGLAADAKLHLEWLVCKVECIPGFGEFEIPQDMVVDQELFEKFEARVPGPSPWKSGFAGQEAGVFRFSLAVPDSESVKEFLVYPHNGENFLTKLPRIEPRDGRLQIEMALSNNANLTSDSETFTVVATKTDGSILAYDQVVATKETPPSVLWGMLLAFLGGLILNLMPCVFPVLFLKAFSFLKETNPRRVRQSAWIYSFGVVVSFVAVGGVLAILRVSGAEVGWGYQLQNPVVIFGLVLLFFVMGLNFFGFFELGDGLVAQGSKLSSIPFFSGSFGTGVLAVIVASPCTAPFMGSALGLTLLLPPFQSLAIFAALGAGMALPMVVLAYAPGLIHRMPRSGAWMIAVKQFMSFPLFATALWLLWVLANQRGSNAVFVTLICFLLVTFSIWLRNTFRARSIKVLALVLLVAVPAWSFLQIRDLKLPTVSEAKSLWAPYDEKVLAEARKTQSVFIDFTASWCITCQVNKKAVLETAEIQELFKKHNVMLMAADWTNHDPVITAALARFRRNSVPLYVFYNKLSNEPAVLSAIITKDMVRNLFEGESK